MMSSLVFLAVGVIIFLYSWVWSREPEQEQIPESPVIDRRWYVRDRPEGGYLIFVERVG